MQTSALPDLAHNDSKPMHWLATATAMAAVVALAGLFQPDASASTSSRSTPVQQRQAEPAAAPDPAEADFPLECGDVGHTVVKQAPGDLDGDDRPETVAVVHCAAGSGTPPSGVYVLTQRSGSAPRVVATLVEPAQQFSVGDFAVRDGVISATLLGYSSSSVPSCCPDQQEKVTWQWQNGAFVRNSQTAEPIDTGI